MCPLLVEDFYPRLESIWHNNTEILIDWLIDWLIVDVISKTRKKVFFRTFSISRFLDFTRLRLSIEVIEFAHFEYNYFWNYDVITRCGTGERLFFMQFECVFQHSHFWAQRSSPQRPFLGRSVAWRCQKRLRGRLVQSRSWERDIRLSLTPTDSSITVAPLLSDIAASRNKSRWRRWRPKRYFSLLQNCSCFRIQRIKFW